MLDLFAIIGCILFGIYALLMVNGILVGVILIAEFVRDKELRKETYNEFVEVTKEGILFGKEIVNRFRRKES